MHRSESVVRARRLLRCGAALVVGCALFSLRAGAEIRAEQAPTLDLTQPVELDQAIRFALANQPSLAIAGSQVGAARSRVTQARSRFFPQIGPSYEYSSQLTTVSTAAGTRRSVMESAVAQIGLRQLVFDTGRREEGVAQARHLQQAAEHNLLDARQDVVLNVTIAYYDVLRRQELVRVAESSADRARTTLEATQAAVEAGTERAIDVLQAQADMENAMVSVSQARNDVRLAQVALRNAMGIVAPVQVQVAAATLPPPAPEPEQRTPADFIRLATESREDLKGTRASISATRRSVRIANIEAGLQVQADVIGGYRFDPDPGESRAFTATLTYPLFDAGLTRARVREMKASVEQAERQLDVALQNLTLEVEHAHLLREEARLRIVATASAVRAARSNYEAARESQREGTGDVIAVITAQTLLVTAETNAVQALYDFHTADARLQRAIGANDPYRTEGDRP
ncbi:MAG TPA: TolC family protein [Chthonomonadales bacterium]|nr:TolC family protein [Chthonomonadales bacterium]